MLLFLLILFVFGTIIGSFLNVVVLRYNTGKSLGGRSGCFSCGQTLHWYELIPILSFVFQKGKCRTCKTRLSVQYPLVEISTGILFLLSGYVAVPLFSISLLTGIICLAIYMAISATLIAISVYDIRHKIIPDKFTIIFLSLSLVYTVFDFSFQNLLAGPLVASPLGALWLVSKGRWMGFGDVKFAVGMGWLLGITFGFSALLLSFWIGACVSIAILLISRIKSLRLKGERLTIKSEIPFGPFLILGTLIMLFFPFNLLSILFFIP